MTRADLDARLLAAHAVDDKAALVELYSEAGNQSEASGDIDAACFYLTHAFVYALEIGASEADALNKRLWMHGRSPRLEF